MIGIRVDVNKTVATGHIVRDLSVARQLRKMGEEVCFVSADRECLPFLEEDGFPAVILDTDWSRMESELEKLEEIIQEKEIKSLLVDSYYVTPHYMKQLSGLTMVTYFDEMFLKGYGCQQVINGVLEPPDYSGFEGIAYTGARYVSLREEFMNLPPKTVRPEIQTIMVTSGGTDNYHFAMLFLESFLKCREWENVQVELVVGGMCVDQEKLKNLYGQHDRVHLHINTRRMSEIMQNADYAITAGGTTLYEICAAGVAASSFSIGDNQNEIVRSFDRQKLISFAGDFRRMPRETIQRIMEHLKEARPAGFRQERARRLQKIVDGKGAERIAGVLKV